MKQLIFALFCALVQAQTSSNPGFRLGYVRAIYIENLGDSDPAKMVRAQLIGAIMSRTSMEIETDRSRTRAILTGTAIVTSGEMQWAVSSSTSENSAAAIVTPTTAAAAASSKSSVGFDSGRRTVRITELGLQLSDDTGKLLWAYDDSNCRDMFSPGGRKQPMQCAVEQMVKAINKDAKKAAKP